MTLRLVTAFGTRLVIRNPKVSEHAWGRIVEGFAQEDGRLFEEYVCARLDTAKSVKWEPAT